MKTFGNRRTGAIRAYVCDLHSGNSGWVAVLLNESPCSAKAEGLPQIGMKPIGFYKRGCQVKTLFLIREEGMFFRHPALSAAAQILARARLAEPISPVVCGVMN